MERSQAKKSFKMLIFRYKLSMRSRAEHELNNLILVAAASSLPMKVDQTAVMRSKKMLPPAPGLRLRSVFLVQPIVGKAGEFAYKVVCWRVVTL